MLLDFKKIRIKFSLYIFCKFVLAFSGFYFIFLFFSTYLEKLLYPSLFILKHIISFSCILFFFLYSEM